MKSQSGEQCGAVYHASANSGSFQMVAEPSQSFGGTWTEVKLSMLKAYLEGYNTALKNKRFSRMYIDAFAGTGYREINVEPDSPGLFTEQAEAEEIGCFDGSARLSLQVEPPFDRYVFVEKNRRRYKDLQKLRHDFPALASRLDVRQGDANEVLPDLCRATNWRNTRAVLFLDPFGMSVDWQTMEVIANTQAMDVWVLFPVGIGVNRLLKQRLEDIPDSWQTKLDRVFGVTEWRDAFFKVDSERTFFGDETIASKVGDSIRAITDFYQQRLRTIFPKVVSNPRYLCNSKSCPMFLFTFAVSNPNPKAQAPALRIAQHILGKVK